MGLPGHFKITGHSGTEFKHRKAFEKIKAYKEQAKHAKNAFNEDSFKLPITSSVPTNYQEAYKQERRIKLFFKLPIFIIAIIVISFVSVNFSNHYVDALNARNYQKQLSYRTEKEIKKLENFTFFYNSGNYHLQKNELNAAQLEFTQVLYLDKYNIDARIGLTETLVARCQQYHELCDEAQIQLDFLDDMDFLTKSRIRDLYHQLRFVNQE